MTRQPPLVRQENGMKKYTDQEIKAFGLDPERIPKHVAIVMDGNGRWATAKGLPRAAGHRAGVNALRDIIRFTSDIGVESLTIYAFSTENRKRPKEEIGILCGLLIEYFNREIDELHANAVRIKSIGDLSWFPTVCVPMEPVEPRSKTDRFILFRSVRFQSAKAPLAPGKAFQRLY